MTPDQSPPRVQIPVWLQGQAPNPRELPRGKSPYPYWHEDLEPPTTPTIFILPLSGMLISWDGEEWFW
jgi:hypothetical protein